MVAMNDTDLLERGENVRASWQGGFGGCPGALRSAFNGYVMPSQFMFDVAGSELVVSAFTSDEFLRRGWVQGIGFAEVDTRSNYHQFSDTSAECPTEEMGYSMTLGKLVTHILGYEDTCNDLGPEWIAHTNMVYNPTYNPHGWIDLDEVEITPFNAATNPDGSMETTRYIVAEADNLWDRLREIARNEFFEIWFDKNDTLYYKKHPMYASSAPSPVMTFDADFAIARPVVEVRDDRAVRQVRLHAVTDNETTLHSDFPTSPTFVYGNTVEISRLRCNAQGALDEWAERHFRFVNRPHTVRWQSAGAVGLLFEILDRVQITYTGTSANGVHIDWDDEKFWVHEIDVIPDAEFGHRTTFTLEAENI